MVNMNYRSIRCRSKTAFLWHFIGFSRSGPCHVMSCHGPLTLATVLYNFFWLTYILTTTFKAKIMTPQRFSFFGYCTPIYDSVHWMLISQVREQKLKIPSMAPFVWSWAMGRRPIWYNRMTGVDCEGGCYAFHSFLILYFVHICTYLNIKSHLIRVQQSDLNIGSHLIYVQQFVASLDNVQWCEPLLADFARSWDWMWFSLKKS